MQSSDIQDLVKLIQKDVTWLVFKARTLSLSSRLKDLLGPVTRVGVGYLESRSCSRDTYQESYITQYTSATRVKKKRSRVHPLGERHLSRPTTRFIIII